MAAEARPTPDRAAIAAELARAADGAAAVADGLAALARLLDAPPAAGGPAPDLAPGPEAGAALDPFVVDNLHRLDAELELTELDPDSRRQALHAEASAVRDTPRQAASDG